MITQLFKGKDVRKGLMGSIGNIGNESEDQSTTPKTSNSQIISSESLTEPSVSSKKISKKKLQRILVAKYCAIKNINNDPLVFPSGVLGMNKSSDGAVNAINNPIKNAVSSPYLPVQEKMSCLQKEIDSIKNEITEQLGAAREEFDDHLSAINENTEELENVYNVFGEMDEKIEKLNSRIDNINMMFNQLLWQTKVSIELNNEEQKIFFVLCNYKNYLKMKFVCGKINVPEINVKESITSLIDKGIPVIQKIIGGQVFLKIDEKFRQMQKKNNIININPAIAKQFENKTLESFFARKTAETAAAGVETFVQAEDKNN